MISFFLVSTNFLAFSFTFFLGTHKRATKSGGFSGAGYKQIIPSHTQINIYKINGPAGGHIGYAQLRKDMRAERVRIRMDLVGKLAKGNAPRSKWEIGMGIYSTVETHTH